MRASSSAFAAAILMLWSPLQADVVVDSFDDLKAWSPNRDGGHAPEIAHQKEGRTGACLRLIYRNQTPKEWGNVRRELSVPADATGIRFWVRVNKAAPRAALHVWLFEADHDGYLVRVRPEGRELCELDDEWREAMVPFSAFRFQPRGNRKRKFLSIETNPNVAFSAEEATENWMQIKGVQVQGKASVVEEKDKGNVGALFIAKYPQMANMPPDPNFVFLKVTLTEAYLLDYTKGFGHRDHVTF